MVSMLVTLVLLLASVLLCIPGDGAGQRTGDKDGDVTNFLVERAAWQPMCLYTFDDPAISNGTSVKNRVPNESCPFDALQPDTDLVTSLNTASTFWQLGVHVAEDPANDTRRVQLSSISSVSMRDFFTMAAVRNDSVSEAGVTFEMVIRRRAKANRSLTLFSIVNEFDNCVDPGFRLDLNEHQVLAFIYFLPMLEEGGEAGVEACYEQRLFSVDNSAACQLPPVLEPVERTPPVQITVTLDPSSDRGRWKTDFYVSYTDADTMQRVDCEVHDEQHPPNTQVLNKLIEGRYRLFLGNSPRNVASPRQRKRLATARTFQPLRNTSNLNATERLRVMLKQKLMSITGPRLPKAMRIFGDNSLSLHILGITFPPLNEDTPLAYLRSKLADFKEQYGDQIVDYLVNLVQKKSRDPIVVQQSQESSGKSSNEGDIFSRTSLFQGAGSATFDLFHFAIYRRVVSKEQANSITRQRLLPSREFLTVQQTVQIPEDSLVLMNLTMLHGVFDDLLLELRGVPEFGQLLLFPNKTVVTLDNKDLFRGLPLEYQRSIFFRPDPGQNNANLPLPNPVAFSRRLKPYATIKFGIADSLAGRIVNKSMEARIDVFVNSVNDAPRPRNSDLEVRVEKGVPVTLFLDGDDIDGAASAATAGAGSRDSSELLASFTFTNVSPVASTTRQYLRIVRMPQFGNLFDCNASCDTWSLSETQHLGSLGITRVYPSDSELAHATHSTNLIYIYHGSGHENTSSASVVFDELWYKLSDGDFGVFSDTAVVKFVLVSGTNESKSENGLAIVRLSEDSLQLLNLGALDPLAAFINASTRFKLTVLPHHGSLYQYNEHDGGDSGAGDGSFATTIANASLDFTRTGIASPNTIVSDPQGRIIYAPKLNYFNLESLKRVSEVDFLEYQVLNTSSPVNDSFVVNITSPTARFAKGLEARRVEFEVMNVPDALVVLPPFVFTANLSNEDTTPIPIAFEDTDSNSSDKVYQVNLEAADGISEFELGFAITDDDVMSGCPIDRPCTLLRSTNGTHLNVSSNSTRDIELKYYITTQLYDPSHVQVTGTKSALTMALSALTFWDLSGVSTDNTRTSEFILWVKRASFGNRSDGEELQAKHIFKINFPVGDSSNSISGDNLVSTLKSQLERSISTLLVLAAVWLVLTNASCLSFGFCCCCCCSSKARKKRRHTFEEQQRLFQAQVAQNDHEYSVLLMSLADMLLEPNLLASLCLLESCIKSKCSWKQREMLTQAFTLRSLLPLLESERQGTRFVFQLMAAEYSERTPGAASFFQHQSFLTQHSTASKALAGFCRTVGTKWLSTLLVRTEDPANYYRGDTITEFEKLLDRLAENVEALPAEIVILCRACVKLFHQDEDGQSREVELAAVHVVFFNHFLGPALLFPQNTVSGFAPSAEQPTTMRKMAYLIVEFTDQWNNCGYSKANDLRSRSSSTDSLLGTFSATARCRYQYEAVLDTISQSSTIASSYDPSEPIAGIDCKLMGMCLMHVHSLLDSNFPEFKRRLRQTQTSTNTEQIEGIISRMTRLLKALGWPLASIQELVEHARPELQSDPVLWNGWGSQDWQDRARHPHQSTCNPQARSAKPQSPLPEQVTDQDAFILEFDGSSPHNVDWLGSS